jgi:hypothetical protein
MARTQTPKNSIPPSDCNHSICFQHYQELEEMIIKLREELQKCYEDKMFYAETLTKTLRDKK